MYLCVCKAVSERTARRAIREQGVVSLRELSRSHGVGTCCGKCVPAARELLEQELSSCTSALSSATLTLAGGVAAVA
ncbi:MAG: (2Fe-2S)-binding protein [Pseudomonadota bacterium]|nr:(2Fe-2S)-binding protein [Pseudomonadota bacterium]